jgi:hypothetical protein
MEAVNSETSINIYQTTRRNIPEDSHLFIRRRENLKSHLMNLYGVATQQYVRRFETIHRSDEGGSKLSETSVCIYQSTRHKIQMTAIFIQSTQL